MLQSMGLQRLGHNLVTEQQQQILGDQGHKVIKPQVPFKKKKLFILLCQILVAACGI